MIKCKSKTAYDTIVHSYSNKDKEGIFIPWRCFTKYAWAIIDIKPSTIYITRYYGVLDLPSTTTQGHTVVL